MGLIGNYYLNGATLASSTYLYTDAALTTPAPQGFYSEGGLYREVIDATGQLGPLNSCQSCASSCPVSITNDMPGPGLYSLEVDLGTTTGAVIITFTPRTTPHGILSTFQGTTYNALSSPVDGYHAAPNPARATYLGDGSDACSLGLVAGSPYSGVIDYDWISTAFSATGLQSNVFVAPSDASFTPLGIPGDCIMVVPKTANVTSNLLVQIPSPASCTNTANISVNCPIKLTGFDGTLFGSGCGKQFDDTYYNAPVTGSLGSPGIHDWIFTDPNGEFVLADGDYIFDVGGANGTPHTVANGVVTVVGTPCP